MRCSIKHAIAITLQNPIAERFKGLCPWKTSQGIHMLMLLRVITAISPTVGPTVQQSNNLLNSPWIKDTQQGFPYMCTLEFQVLCPQEKPRPEPRKVLFPPVGRLPDCLAHSSSSNPSHPPTPPEAMACAKPTWSSSRVEIKQCLVVKPTTWGLANPFQPPPNQPATNLQQTPTTNKQSSNNDPFLHEPDQWWHVPSEAHSPGRCAG